MEGFLLVSCRAAGMGSLIIPGGRGGMGGELLIFSREDKTDKKRGFPRVFACFAPQNRQKNSQARRLSTSN
jgi:hypothetical protein